MTNETDSKNTNHVLGTRILEVIIAAAIIGLMNMYASSYALNERFEVIKAQIEDIKTTLNQLKNDFYVPRFRK